MLATFRDFLNTVTLHDGADPSTITRAPTTTTTTTQTTQVAFENRVAWSCHFFGWINWRSGLRKHMFRSMWSTKYTYSVFLLESRNAAEVEDILTSPQTVTVFLCHLRSLAVTTKVHENLLRQMGIQRNPTQLQGTIQIAPESPQYKRATWPDEDLEVTPPHIRDWAYTLHTTEIHDPFKSHTCHK